MKAKKEKTEGENSEELKVENLDEKGIRRIIKFESEDREEKAEKQVKNEKETGKETSSEQKIVMQSLKDLDFQIKKNREEIEKLNKRVEEISRDLDDLVSLYEIVSEQMNPFVGLSKITKQRLEALENYTKDIQNLKTRIEQIELALGRSLNEEVSNEEEVPEKNLDDVINDALNFVSLEKRLEEEITNFLDKLR